MKELTLLERLNLSLYYSISENHKKDLTYRINQLESIEIKENISPKKNGDKLIYEVAEQGQIRWLPGF